MDVSKLAVMLLERAEKDAKHHAEASEYAMQTYLLGRMDGMKFALQFIRELQESEGW